MYTVTVFNEKQESKTFYHLGEALEIVFNSTQKTDTIICQQHKISENAYEIDFFRSGDVGSFALIEYR